MGELPEEFKLERSAKSIDEKLAEELRTGLVSALIVRIVELKK